MKTKYNLNIKLSLLLFIIGTFLLIYPIEINKLNNDINISLIEEQMKSIKTDMEKEMSEIKDDNSESPVNKYDKLYEDMKEYNNEIYTSGQNSLLDPFMFEVPSLKLSDYNIPSEIFGYISIPKIDITLPIYLGATKENMKLGAAYLASTSYPIGGVNSNTVICAHRGLSTQAMFRNIERLDVGDRITVTNYWETLTYEVKSFAVIYPDEVQNIFIQEGKDMLTLSTCHPYRYNYKRYLVFCERISP